MKITDEGKEIINEMLAKNKYDCLKAMLQKSCCGTSVYFILSKLNPGDEPVLINGVPVMMDNETKERAETITLAAENGKLVIKDDKPSCC